MKAKQAAFGRRGKASGSTGKQAVFGKYSDGNNRPGRKNAGQAKTPPLPTEPDYGSVHKHETSFTDGYRDKLGKSGK